MVFVPFFICYILLGLPQDMIKAPSFKHLTWSLWRPFGFPQAAQRRGHEEAGLSFSRRFSREGCVSKRIASSKGSMQQKGTTPLFRPLSFSAHIYIYIYVYTCFRVTFVDSRSPQTWICVPRTWFHWTQQANKSGPPDLDSLSQTSKARLCVEFERGTIHLRVFKGCHKK